MAHVPSFGPAPRMGAIFCRNHDQLGREESMVVWRNVRDGGHWDALLMTNENFFPISSGGFSRAVQHTDWRPIDFLWHDDAFMFTRPNIKWDADKSVWEELVEVVPEPVETPALPTAKVLPAPKKDEHHAAWRARCRRKFPALDTPEGRTLLGEVWNEHKTTPE